MAQKLMFEIKYKEEALPRVVEDTYGVFRFSKRLNHNNHIAILSNTNSNSKKLLEIFNGSLTMEYFKVVLDDNIIEEQIQNFKFLSYENSYGYIESQESPIEQIFIEMIINK